MSDFNTEDIADPRSGTQASEANICGVPWGGGILLGSKGDEDYEPRNAMYEGHHPS